VGLQALHLGIPLLKGEDQREKQREGGHADAVPKFVFCSQIFFAFHVKLPPEQHTGGFVFHAPYYRKHLIKRVLRKNGRVFRFCKREQVPEKAKAFHG
jgi:hypothetical protein